jgi:hypothetical protein
VLEWMKRLFSRGYPPTIIDPDFGKISFESESDDHSRGYWQMHDDWDLGEGAHEVGCNSIPGNGTGPSEAARRFLLAKKASIEEIWRLCTPTLEEERRRWKGIPTEGALRAVYRLSSIGLDEPITATPTWSAGFETTGDFWCYMECQIEGNRVLGHHTDT